MDRMLLKYHEEARAKNVRGTHTHQEHTHLYTYNICTYRQCTHTQNMKKKQVLVISACAFDSVPADLGTLFAQRVYISMDLCPHMHKHILYVLRTVKGSRSTVICGPHTHTRLISNLLKTPSIERRTDKQVFRESGGAALASVESFLSIDTGG